MTMINCVIMKCPILARPSPCLNKWTCKARPFHFKIIVQTDYFHVHGRTHRKEAKVEDLTYECLEQMDNLILQSSKGMHLLFEKNEIILALNDAKRHQDEKDIDKLKKIQEVLYKFISLKKYSEKRDFLKTLGEDEQSLLIRAYFKIVENSMITKDKVRH